MMPDYGWLVIEDDDDQVDGATPLGVYLASTPGTEVAYDALVRSETGSVKVLKIEVVRRFPIVGGDGGGDG